MSDTTPNEKDAQEKNKDFTAGKIVTLALTLYDTVRSTEGRLLAVPKNGGIAIEIKSLGNALLSHIWSTTGYAVSTSTIKTALDTLEGLTANKPPVTVALRSHQKDSLETGPSHIYVDLGAQTDEAVFIHSGGWFLKSEDLAEAEEEHCDIPVWPMFRRTVTVQPLPTPVRGFGGREKLAAVLNLEPHDPRFYVIWGWLVASVFVNVQRPALWLTGPQGSGKTTTGLFALSVINPSERMGGNFGKNERDDLTLLAGSFIPSFDNVTSVSASVNDFICRMVTGSMETSRALFTNGELYTSTIMRTAVFSSINLPIGLREDGLERIVHVAFDRIDTKDRLREGAIRSQFEKDQPEILGALFDDVAGVLKNFTAASEKMQNHLPRMADYATVLCALDLHLLGNRTGRSGVFLTSYLSVLQTSMEERALDDPFTQSVIRIAQQKFKGTYKELLEKLEHSPDRPSDFKAFWPSNPRQLGESLKRHSESLRAVGVVIKELGRKSNGNHLALSMDPKRTKIKLAPEKKPSLVLTTNGKTSEVFEQVKAQ